MMYLTLQSLMEYIRKIYNEMSMENIKLKDTSNEFVNNKSNLHFTIVS